MNVLEVTDLVRNYRKTFLTESEDDVKVLRGLNFTVTKIIDIISSERRTLIGCQ